MVRSVNRDNLPFQVREAIEVLESKENVYVKQNYYDRLQDIVLASLNAMNIFEKETTKSK